MSEIGISPSEFWSLSWYEWGLYLLRYEKSLDKEKREYEAHWERTRIMWATLVNVNAGKGKGVNPKDLIELSYDKKEKALVIPKAGDITKKFKSKK